jgi:hypothetical protein
MITFGKEFVKNLTGNLLKVSKKLFTAKFICDKKA